MEVCALVGGSGTGKSHRAAFVASDCQADLIIDDGLVIKGSRILGGMSAKSRPSMLGAVRTALFTNPLQAEQAKAIIAAENPGRILIIGTSTGMVKKISQRLDLPDPETFIYIEDIATEKEIETARYMRRVYGKHVIPAPKTEVRKSLSGLLIDPIHVFLRLKNKPKPARPYEKTLVRPPYFLLGRISISDGTLNTLTQKIVEDSGLPVKVGKALVEQSPEGVRINLSAQVKLGTYIPGILADIQEQVKDRLEYMTGLHILSVDIIANRIDMGP